jgi:CRISPR-associated protein Cas1
MTTQREKETVIQMDNDSNNTNSLQWNKLDEWKSSHKKVCYLNGKSELLIKGKTLLITRLSKQVKIAIDEIERIIVIGRPYFGINYAYDLLKKGISIEFYDYFFHPKATMQAIENQDSIPLFVSAQDNFQKKEQDRLNLANLWIEMKIKNCRSVLMRRGVKIPNQLNIPSPLKINEIDKLMGFEGITAKVYFRELAKLVAPFSFTSRQPRPAPDPINMLLSFGYSLIHNRIGQALIRVGLNPRIGFLHIGRGTHWALASDLMEDLRFIVDRMVIRLVRKKCLKPEDFKTNGKQCSFKNNLKFSVFVTEFERMMSGIFSSSGERPGIKVGDKVCFNQWIDATAKGYAGLIANGDHLEPFKSKA